jgi:hypothetical protein
MFPDTWLCGQLVLAQQWSASHSIPVVFQLCGVRGGGEAASQAMFWRPRSDLSLALAFETARERNTAIMLARRFAIDCNVRASCKVQIHHRHAMLLV